MPLAVVSVLQHCRYKQYYSVELHRQLRQLRKARGGNAYSRLAQRGAYSRHFSRSPLIDNAYLERRSTGPGGEIANGQSFRLPLTLARKGILFYVPCRRQRLRGQAAGYPLISQSPSSRNPVICNPFPHILKFCQFTCRRLQSRPYPMGVVPLYDMASSHIQTHSHLRN